MTAPRIPGHAFRGRRRRAGPSTTIGGSRSARTSPSSPAGRRPSTESSSAQNASVCSPSSTATRVVLVGQYRYVARDFYWEIPTGGQHAGETLEEAAQRELAEEAGYEAGRLVKLCDFHTSKSILREVAHLYMATELRPASRPAGSHRVHRAARAALRRGPRDGRAGGDQGLDDRDCGAARRTPALNHRKGPRRPPPSLLQRAGLRRRKPALERRLLPTRSYQELGSDGRPTLCRPGTSGRSERGRRRRARA